MGPENGQEVHLIKIQYRTRMRLFLTLGFSVLVLLLILSCREKSEKKTFSEVQGFDTPVQGQEIKLPAQPHGATPPVPEAAAPAHKLDWTLPSGWNAHPGGGMFYAVLKTSSQPDADEGGIVVLPGEAGGLQANIERWAGQLGISLDPKAMEGFISTQKKIKTKGNLDLMLVDFNPLADKNGRSMLVGITKPGDDSYFIKLTGPRGNMLKAKADFEAFCQSLVLN